MTLEATRRSMLKGAALGAGATLLGPMLNQLAAQAAGAAETRRCVVFVVQSNGMNPEHLTPLGRKHDKNSAVLTDLPLADQRLPPPIEALAPFQDRLTLTHGLSGKIALSDHSANHGCLGCYPANKGPLEQTIDSALGDALPAIVPHVALGLSGSSEPMNYRLSASGPGKAVPIVCSPDQAYKSLFGSVAEGVGRQQFNRRTHLLDHLADDARRARAALVGEERAKLDQYVEAFERLSARQRDIVAIEDALRKHTPKLGEKQTTSVSSTILEAQFEMAAAALIAGLTNVVTLSSGGGGQQFGKFPEFGIPDLHHIGHGGSYGDKTYEECFVELRRFHVKLIAGLAEKLQAIKLAEGTLLDRVAIVYISDSGESHHPRLEEWPVAILGDLGGKLNTRGRYVQFPKYGARGHRTLANLYLALLEAAGKPRAAFGVPDPGLRDLDQTGPLGELLA